MLAIGPGGVLVVESKYSSSGWEGGHVRDERVSRAVKQAGQNRHDLCCSSSRSRPVLRFPTSLFVPSLSSGAGRTGPRTWSLQMALRSCTARSSVTGSAQLPTRGSRPEEVAAAWTKLREHTGTRDKAELERLGPPPQHLRDWLFDLGRGVLVAGAGLVAGLELVRATGPVWFLAVGAGLASLSWAASRLKLRRLWWFAWLTGTQAVTALFAVAYVATWLLHLTH